MTVQPPHYFQFSQESQFRETMAGPVAELWQRRQEGMFEGVDQLKVGWVSLTGFNHDKAIIVVNGRIESYWKYQELFYDLVQQGYDVFALDHRGQGVSDRLAEDTELGHIEEFDDYVSDLKTFFECEIAPRNYCQHFMLAHSMGGTIASLFLAENPGLIDSAVLSAPMHGIHINNWMKPIASPLARVVEQMQRQPGYAPGQVPYYPKPFADNPLCQSQIRYQWFRDLYEQKPELKIGGPSARWVWQGLAAARRCIARAPDITTPILLLQGSEDNIVDNQAQNLFCHTMQQAGRHCQLKVIEGARHELLFEVDKYRHPVLSATISHFRKAETIES
ncbi:alpha/beta fold hydrolase [Photobacterium atrarenae]|uniref:Alpha/beta fold hydrolase n=1 Tax=Photobacterium atrarenae TaxID=865757 RepID=A0ABY5GFD5_9GAMM|nr:alpha/beta fold hydrolase [Photobacterium atrarenae]UTV27825.1 alpha/beta fold hydrolase [Photobacterium atrarenae]